MQITLYNFSKRANSTKVPSGGTSYNVNLKGGCSKESPSFLIADNVGNLLNFNYAHAFGHYYFITDCIIINDSMCEIRCNEDVLATYRSEIGNATAMILRSSHSNDPYLHDSQVLANNKYKFVGEYVNSFVSQHIFSNRGFYLLRCIGKSSSTVTGVNTYALTESNVSELLDFAFTESNFGDILSDEVVKTIFNPFQYIVSIDWVPFNSDFLTYKTTEKIWLGWFETSVYGVIYDPTAKIAFGVAVPNGWKQYNDFRDIESGWSEFTMYLPGVGNVVLDGNAFLADSIEIEYTIDLIGETSQCFVYLRRASGDSIKNLYRVLNCDFKVPIQIGQMQPMVSTAISSVGSVIGSLFGKSSDPVPDIASATSFARPDTDSTGIPGSRALFEYHSDPILYYRVRESKDIDNAHKGRPLCKVGKISDYPGYLECSNVSISIDGYDGEREAINNYMNGGFYYE